MTTAEWVSFIRQVSSLLINIGTACHDEVVIRLTSPGGSVSEYGLAAAHLLRLKQAGLHTTVCVDTVAASGGYMIACCADNVVAAPFAMIGSIGVVAGLPNFHKLLERAEVEFKLYTAGEFKRTVHPLTAPTHAGAKCVTQVERGSE